jgi:TPR repeat protein
LPARRDGISRNKEHAVHYFTLSADQGNAIAQFDYDVMLVGGDGILVNKSLAAN